MKIQNSLKLVFITIIMFLTHVVNAQTGSQSLWGWGDNYDGQLGLGNTTQQNSPKLILDSSEFKSITTGVSHTLAIKKDGTLWAWGWNYYGQLGLGNTTQYNSPQQVGTDTTWISIAAGNYHTLAIKKDGTLWAWGPNGRGQLGLGNTTQYNSPQQVGTDTTWVSISAGPMNTCAIKNDGTLWTWGYNADGQLGLGNTIDYYSPQQVGTDTTWTSITAFYYHQIAIKQDGTLWAWGDNDHGQLGLGNTTDYYSPQQVGTDTTWASISAGAIYTCAIKKDGTLWAWGNNYYGQLGLGNTTNYQIPKQIGTDSNWATISAGNSHNLATKKDGSLWAWGNNVYGQLGLSNTNNYNTPQQVGTDTTWTSISSGGYHSIAIKTRKPCKINNYKSVSNSDTLSTWNTTLDLQSQNSKIQSYKWSNGSTNSKITVSQSGLYSLVETDSNGCIGESKLFVVLGCKPSNHTRLTNSDSIHSCTSLKLTSKNKSYSKYRWSTGDSSLSTVIAKSGLVTLRETDSKGCVNIDSVYVRIVKDEISQAPDTFLCNVNANDTLKLDLQNWFENANVMYFDQAKNPVSTANFFVKAGINRTWTGYAALNSYPSLKCPIKGKVNASVVYPRLVNKFTDTIKMVAALVKPSILDAKYNKYRWSTGDTTRNITLQNSGSYWYAHYWNATINGVGRYCYQMDSFHLSRINLITPSRISAKLGSKIIIKVKDSLNSNSMVVWSNGDTGWNTVYSVTKNSDTLFATQKDAYRSVTKSTVIVGRLEPIKASQEGNATGEENGSGNGAGTDTGNGSGESNGNGSSEDTNDVNSTQMNNSSNNTADAVAVSSTNIRIYPNPVGSEITLDGITHPMKYEIHTVTGQLVQTGQTSPKINVNNLQTGIYILKLENVSVKFVKECLF